LKGAIQSNLQRRLYKNFGEHLVSVSIIFLAKEIPCKRQPWDPEKEGWRALKGWGGHATLFALAGASNMCAAAITNPVNVVKVRMQLDGALSSTQVSLITLLY
jgi:hypothetical protein